MHVPSATAGIFQAMMLFFILASDVLVRRRIRIEWGRARKASGGARMNLDLVIAAFLTVVNLTTPILLAATGELVVEKSGVLNLGVEGMMLCGAIAGFAVTFDLLRPGSRRRRSLARGGGAVARRRRGRGGGGAGLAAVRLHGADARRQSGGERAGAGRFSGPASRR